MALKTKLELETLDVVYLGQPFVQVSTKTINSQSLDTVYLGQPFVATDPAATGNIVSFEATVASTATMAVSAQVNRDLDAVLSAQATATAVSKRIRNAEATVASATDVTTTVNYTTDNDVFVQAEFQFTADGTLAKAFDVFTQADTSLAVSGQVLRDIDAVMSGGTDVTASGVVRRGFVIDLQAEFQFTADGKLTKNFSANLEEAATISVQGQRNTDIDLVAFSESAVTTAFTRIRDGDIAAVESFTQFTADGLRILDLDAVLTSQSEFFANISRKRLGSTDISSAATADFSVGRIRQINRNPKIANRVGSPVISTVQSRFGGSSVFFSGSNSQQINYPATTFYPDFTFGTDAWTIEAWIYPTNITGTRAIVANATEGAAQRPKFYISSGTLRLLVNGSDRITSNTSLTANTWTHVAVSRNASGVHRMFINGVLQTQTWTNTTSYTTSLIRIGNNVNNDNQYLGYIDDLRISKGVARYTASFTAPTEQLRNDANTVLLLNFDGANNSTTFRDSASEYLDAASAVTSVIGVKKPLSADLSCSATLSAAVNYKIDSDAVLQSEASLTSTPGFIFDVPVDLEASAGTLTAAAKIGAFLVDLPAHTTLTADISVISPITVDISSSSSLSVNAGKLIELIREEPVTWDEISSWSDWYREVWDPVFSNENYVAETSLNADGRAIQIVSADLSSASSLTVDAKKSVTLAANVSSTASADIAALRTKQLAATILAEGFAVTAAAKIADFFVPMTTTATLDVTGSTDTFVSANLNSATDLLADANVAFVGAANLDNVTSLTANGDVVISGSADLSSQATLSAALRRLIKANADLNSATDLTAQTLGSVTGSADLNAVTVQTATAKKTARITADLNTRATFAARVDRIVRFSADIQSNGFILVAGEVLQLDPELTYVIEQETRTFVITGEDREYIIDEESRVYIISEETREYAVEPSTAVNII